MILHGVFYCSFIDSARHARPVEPGVERTYIAVGYGMLRSGDLPQDGTSAQSRERTEIAGFTNQMVCDDESDCIFSPATSAVSDRNVDRCLQSH